MKDFLSLSTKLTGKVRLAPKERKMGFILITVKALTLIILTVAAFLALAFALGADLGESQDIASCISATPTRCLFMIV